MRKILHCDLNCFYASVECLKRPELKNFPVAVCGNPSLRHGIVLAKNQIAKSCGIKTGDTLSEAKKKAKNVIFIHTNYDSYIYYSQQVFNLYKEYSDFVENFGIDECWIDISHMSNSLSIAKEIKNRIKNEIGITVSIGVSFNKIFAKLGSDLADPDDIYLISENDFKEKIWHLPIENLLFVGKSTAIKLNNLGIKNIGELATYDSAKIQKLLGKNGLKLINYAKGNDNSKVSHWSYKEIEKSISSGITTPIDLINLEQAQTLILSLCEDVGARLRRKELKCSKLQITVKNSSLKSVSFTGNLISPTYSTSEIYNVSVNIFKEFWNFKYTIRAISICATDLSHCDFQVSFFSDNIIKKEKLDKTIDCLNTKFDNCVFRASKLETDAITEYFNNNIGLHKVAFSNNVLNIK